MDLQALTDIEQIRQLKARYFRLMDQRKWDEWTRVFSADAVATFKVAHRESRYEGRAAVVKSVRDFMADAVSAHQGFMPEITLTGPTTAKGIWAMFDMVRKPATTLHGYGHYEEEYVKEGGDWKIKSLLLTRLHVEIVPNVPQNAKA